MKELHIETRERIVKLIPNGNPQFNMAKDFGFPSQLCLEFRLDINEMGRLKKHDISVDDKRVNIRSENSVQFDLKIENVKKKIKIVEISVQVSDRIIRKQLNGMS